MKKIFTFLFLLPTYFGGSSQSTTVIISQVYGGAGCGTSGCSTYQNDFIEIFNKSNAPISLNGWSVQYASATGSTWSVTALPNISLNPGQYFLVAESFGANGVNPLPIPDVTGSITMSATAGKVALVNTATALTGTCPSSASIIDLVGYGATANCSETSVASAPSTTTADIRGNNGCTDTNNNSTDFSLLSPNPRNSASSFNICAVAVVNNYYNTKANSGLNATGTWSSTLDGTGASPANFTDPYQYFNVVNQTNANLTAVWDVSTGTSKVIVGDGVNPLILNILAGPNYISSTTVVDVLNNATVDFGNNILPQLNNMATGSTVAFSQTGIVVPGDVISIPANNYYNLTLNNGLKYFASGTTTVRGNLVANAVVSINGAASPFSTLNVFGNVNFSGGSAFEPLLTGDGNRLTLKMNGPGPTQQINGNGTELMLFRLQRDSAAVNTIQLGANTTLTLGNSASGGLSLNPAAATLALGANTINFIGAASSSTSASGRISAGLGTINVLKSAGTANAGTLRFNPGAVLAQFTLNLGPAVTGDSVTIADNVTVAFVNLLRGKIVMTPGDTLSADMMIAPTVAPYSFVDGALRVSGTTNLRFAVGKGNNFAPVGISNFGAGLNTYTVHYFNTGLGNYTIDPATLATYPAYDVNKSLYWRVTSNNANPYDVAFGYTDASAGITSPGLLRMTNFDNTDWSDQGGYPDPASTTGGGIVYVPGLTVFGPFTFSAIASGIVPVKLSGFAAQKINNTAKISWTTEQEINSKEFAVERSTDGGKIWTTISIVTAAGNSSAKLQYNIVDNTPSKGINLYRLRSVDVDAKYTNSDTKAVLFSNADAALITPNPASSFINVYMSKNNNSISQIIISDVNGKLMERINTAEQSYQVDVSRYSKGMYVIKVIGAENTSTQKVIIQ